MYCYDVVEPVDLIESYWVIRFRAAVDLNVPSLLAAKDK